MTAATMDNTESTSVSFTETVSTTKPSATMNTNSTSATSNETVEDVTSKQDQSAKNESADVIKIAKRASTRRGFRTAGEAISMVTIVGGAVYGANAARPIVISKILEVTGWGTTAAIAEGAAVEAVAAEVVAVEGAAGFLGGSVQVGSIAIPEVALAAAAVIAVAAVGYAGYKYYKGRQVKKAAAVGTEKPTTAAEAEAKIEAAVEAVEDGNLKSFLKGLLDGAKTAVGSLKILVYTNIAFILAAVAAGAGFAVIASLIYAAVGLYCLYVLTTTLFKVSVKMVIVSASKAIFAKAANTANMAL